MPFLQFLISSHLISFTLQVVFLSSFEACGAVASLQSRSVLY